MPWPFTRAARGVLAGRAPTSGQASAAGEATAKATGDAGEPETEWLVGAYTVGVSGGAACSAQAVRIRSVMRIAKIAPTRRRSTLSSLWLVRLVAVMARSSLYWMERELQKSGFVYLFPLLCYTFGCGHTSLVHPRPRPLRFLPSPQLSQPATGQRGGSIFDRAHGSRRSGD